MPIATATLIGLAPLLGGAAAGGATVAGAALSSRASNRATKANASASDQALQLERDNEMRRRQEYDQQLAEERRQWEAREARKAPVRAYADALMQRRLGVPPQRPTSSGLASLANPRPQQPVIPSPPSVPRPSGLGELARRPMTRRY